MGTTPTAIAVPRGATGNVRNLATQIRSQSVPVVADAVLAIQKQLDDISGSISSVTASVAASLAPPTPGSNPAAPYTDLPSGFAITNSRYDLNSSGQRVLKLDAAWTNPPDLRYGGSYIVRKKPSDAAPTVVMALNAGAAFTIMVSDFPTATENWQFWLISQDTSGNLNTSLTAPVAGTPTLTLAISPPSSGGSGIEFTANVSLGAVSVNAVQNADSTFQQYITANFTPPSDARWGGVEIRIYNGVVLVAKNDSTKSPILVNIPNPIGTVTYTVKLVSYDVNNHANTEQAGITPQTTVSVGSVSGSFSTGIIDASIANLININASNIVTGHLFAVDVKVSNIAGSGIVTDITQGVDALLGFNTGIVVKVSATSQRNLIGPAGFYLVNASNVQTGYFITSGGTGLLSLFDTAGGGIAITAGGGTGNTIVLSSSSVNRAIVGVDGSALGYFQMNWGGTGRFAPGVNANGKRMVWGSTGTFNGGTPAQATVNTGLAAIESFNVTVVRASGTAESAYIVSAAGGSITFESTLAGSVSGFNWYAVGT